MFLTSPGIVIVLSHCMLQTREYVIGFTRWLIVEIIYILSRTDHRAYAFIAMLVGGIGRQDIVLFFLNLLMA
jgi:hypothetical protein